MPLKVFIKCEACSQPFTGYIVKAKGLWYYKCRTIGCKCNKSAKKLHAAFEELLKKYSADHKMAKVIAYQSEHLFE